MPRFSPFAGLRYDPTRVEVAKVVAPPYDVVGPAERADLAARHSANSILVELPEPDTRSGGDRYEAAAARLAEWRADGILVRDPGPAFYPYRMTDTDGSVTLGVLGVLGLDKASAAEILPHEETLPRPRRDRLELLSATRVNLSPIWGLSLAAGLTALLVDTGDPLASRGRRRRGPPRAVGRSTTRPTIDAIADLVGSAPVVVADGHHRLAIASTYLAGGGAGTPGADGVLALVVELAEDVLSVGPDPPAPVRAARRARPGRRLRLVVRRGPGRRLRRPHDGRARRVVGPGPGDGLGMLAAPSEGRDGRGGRLRPVLVDGGAGRGRAPDHELTFANSWQEAVAAVGADEAQAAVLLPPVRIDQIDAWAHARRRMPPKSTYFHPKPRTGMVFRPLDPA